MLRSNSESEPSALPTASRPISSPGRVPEGEAAPSSGSKLIAVTSAERPMQQMGVEPAGPLPEKSQIVTWLPPDVAR